MFYNKSEQIQTGRTCVKDKNSLSQRVDVICQHSRDGRIIPLRIRLMDEDGEFHVYAIKGYKELAGQEEFKLPNGVPATSHTWLFECRILVFAAEKRIRLFYNAYDNMWRMDYVG